MKKKDEIKVTINKGVTLDDLCAKAWEIAKEQGWPESETWIRGCTGGLIVFRKKKDQ